MHKHQHAAAFFSRLGEDNQYVTQMIEREMTPELIDMINQFSQHMNLGDLDAKRYQSSLMIIGYLIRAHEDTVQEDDVKTAAKEAVGKGSQWH
jgi:hypothetical protein